MENIFDDHIQIIKENGKYVVLWKNERDFVDYRKEFNKVEDAKQHAELLGYYDKKFEQEYPKKHIVDIDDDFIVGNKIANDIPVYYPVCYVGNRYRTVPRNSTPGHVIGTVIEDGINHVAAMMRNVSEIKSLKKTKLKSEVKVKHNKKRKF